MYLIFNLSSSCSISVGSLSLQLSRPARAEASGLRASRQCPTQEEVLQPRQHMGSVTGADGAPEAKTEPERQRRRPPGAEEGKGVLHLWDSGPDTEEE